MSNDQERRTKQKIHPTGGGLNFKTVIVIVMSSNRESGVKEYRGCQLDMDQMK